MQLKKGSSGLHHLSDLAIERNYEEPKILNYKSVNDYYLVNEKC